MPGGRLGQRIVHRRVGRLCTLGTDGESADADCDVNGVGQRIAGDQPVSVRALAYVIAGHGRHHLEVLKARYTG